MKTKYKPDWNKRPKGCKKTISGMHIPNQWYTNYTISFNCTACGLIDDTGKFQEWLFGPQKKIDDRKPLQK